MSRTTASNRVTLCIHKAAPTSSAQENNRPKTVFSERGGCEIRTHGAFYRPAV